MDTETIEIARRFRGPPASGNGGYVCGLVARNLSGAVRVRLSAPPPLETGLRREWTHDAARLLHAGQMIAEASTSTLSVEPPAPPSLALAEQASASFEGFHDHPFPGCFVCGPERKAGDGLRIFAGPMAGGLVHAAPWVPDASLADAHGQVAREFIWAALDCPSGFAGPPAPEGTALVLGELCAAISGTLMVGEPAVVLSWLVARKGRRRTAGAALFGAAGRPVAVARAIWIEVPRDRWSSPG